MGVSLNINKDEACRLAGEPTQLTGRKDTTMTKRLKNPLTQTMIFVLLLVYSIPAWGNPLHDAAGKGDTAAVKALVEAGMDVEAKDHHGWTALHIAAMEGHPAVVKVLLEAGANVNAQDNTDGTALLNAAMIGHYAIIKTLLEAGANIEAKDNHGWTALSLAAMRGDTAIVKLLKAAKR